MLKIKSQKIYLTCDPFFDRNGNTHLISSRYISQGDYVINRTSGMLFNADTFAEADYMTEDPQFAKVECTSCETEKENISLLPPNIIEEIKSNRHDISVIELKLISCDHDLHMHWMNIDHAGTDSASWKNKNEHLIGESVEIGVKGYAREIKVLNKNNIHIHEEIANKYIGATPEDFDLENWNQLKECLVEELNELVLQ